MKRKLLAALITAVFAAPAAYAQGTTAPRDSGVKDRPAATKSKDGSPDAVITGKIKTGFINDKIVRSRNYNVDTSGGVVTVRGKARSQAEADRAIEIARSTQGVSSVKNEIQVIASADRTTDKPRRDTRAAAGTSPREPSDPVAKADAKKAGDMSASAKGSTSAPASKQGSSPDALITTKIKAEHAKDKDVSATRISVDTNNGVVTLSGTAKSKAEADKAVQLARNVKDVKSVKNNIKIEAK
jgi:hyperosmotically inducible protein